MEAVSDKPFADQFRWKKLSNARPWRPKEGASIAGYYRGRTLRSGRFGQYEVVIVDTEDGVFTVSGTVLISTIDVNQVPEGQPIKITYVGRVQVGDTERWWKRFTVEVADAR